MSLALLVTGITYYSLHKKSAAQEQQIQVLTQQIKNSAVEDLVDVLVAKSGIKSGTLFDPTTVEFQKWNRKYVSPNIVVDSSLLTDNIWKINVSAGSPITSDMLTKESYGPTDRLQLVLVDAITPSLEVGDYVDIRMVTPYGINYVVMSKKRITNIYESGIEIVMSEAELMMYQGLLIDQYMNPGTMVYTSKYLAPTLQKAMYTMYVPPKDIVDYMKINANMLYPYLASDDVQGLRSYIESTQPWTLYGPSTFQTVTQGIIDKQTKIASSNNAIGSAMKAARAQYIQRQQELAQANGVFYVNQGSATSQVPGQGSNVTTQTNSSNGDSTGKNTTMNPDGTYTGADGVTRNSAGQPVISPSDLGGGTNAPSLGQVQQQQQQQQQQPQATGDAGATGNKATNK